MVLAVEAELHRPRYLSLWRCGSDDGEGTLEIVGDGGGMDLGGCFSDASPSNPT